MTNASDIAYSPALFVARKEYVEAVLRAIDAAQEGSAASRTVIFTGERGIGKSWLMAHLRSQVPGWRPGVKVFWFDLAEFAQFQDAEVAVKAILRQFRKEITKQEDEVDQTLADMSRTAIDEFHGLGRNQPLVVLADSVYESKWETLAVLEDYFLGPLAIEPRVVIVMAGRGRAYPWSTAELGTHADIHALPQFDEEETGQQIESLRQSSEIQLAQETTSQRIADILKYSLGNPLVNLHLATQEVPSDALNSAIDAMLSVVAERERPQIREYLTALSVLRSFKEDRIPAMLTAYGPTVDQKDGDYSDWTYAQAREVREKLTRNAFATWEEKERGYVISASPKKQIEAYLEIAENDRWMNLHCMAYFLYSRWAKEYERAADHWTKQRDYHLEKMTDARRSPDERLELQVKLDELEGKK